MASKVASIRAGGGQGTGCAHSGTRLLPPPVCDPWSVIVRVWKAPPLLPGWPTDVEMFPQILAKADRQAQIFHSREVAEADKPTAYSGLQDRQRLRGATTRLEECPRSPCNVWKSAVISKGFLLFIVISLKMPPI